MCMRWLRFLQLFLGGLSRCVMWLFLFSIYLMRAAWWGLVFFWRLGWAGGCWVEGGGYLLRGWEFTATERFGGHAGSVGSFSL